MGSVQVPRRAKKETIDGDDYFVRSLTPRETEAIDAVEDPGQRLALTLRDGWCDTQGEPKFIATDGDAAVAALKDVPQGLQVVLYRAVRKATNPPREELKND
jgi:hypothetical protein